MLFLAVKSVKHGVCALWTGVPPWRALSVSVLRASAQSRNSACLDIQGHPVIFF